MSRLWTHRRQRLKCIPQSTKLWFKFITGTDNLTEAYNRYVLVPMRGIKDSRLSNRMIVESKIRDQTE